MEREEDLKLVDLGDVLNETLSPPGGEPDASSEGTPEAD